MSCAATSPASVIRRRAGESQDVLSPRSSGIPARRLYRHQPGSSGRARCRLLQSARHSEQSIKEGKGAIKWTRLSCRTFAANAVRLQLHALAYNLGYFMRTLAMPKAAEPWSLTSFEKLIKIGAGCPPWAVRHVPDGRGRGVASDVRRNPGADRPAAGAARASMTEAVVRCDGRRCSSADAQ